MKQLILGELLVTVLAAIVFLIVFLAEPYSSDDPNVRATRNHLIAATMVPLTEAAGLALLGLGVPIPIWILAVAYGAGAAVMVHRVILVIRARRPESRP